MKKRKTINIKDVTKPYLEKLYCSALGRVFLKILIRPSLSKFAGFLLDRNFSCIIIPRFIKKNNIDMSLYEEREYKSFNDFFTREKKEKSFEENEKVLISPCDGSLSVYKINENSTFKIKSVEYTLTTLLENEDLASKYRDGMCLVFRLSVDDYHRYCYVDSGKKSENCHIDGVLHTVRPIAVLNESALVKNTREYTVLSTDNFGEIVQIEVGAMLVGRIKNHHGEYSMKKGEEKGMFEYGGSTVVLLLKKDSVRLDDEFWHNTSNDLETKVKYGEAIGISQM